MLTALLGNYHAIVYDVTYIHREVSMSKSFMVSNLTVPTKKDKHP